MAANPERGNPVAGYSGIFLSEEQASILSGGQDMDKLLALITLGGFQKYYSSLFLKEPVDITSKKC